MATDRSARLEEALLGPNAEEEWRVTLERTLEAALDAPLGSLVDAAAAADFLDLLGERAFVHTTARPLLAAIARFLVVEAQTDPRPLASYIAGDTQAALTSYVGGMRQIPAPLLEALFAEERVRAIVEEFLFDAMREFYERANPFFADSGLPAIVRKLVPIGSGAVLKALDAARGEFEARLEPELKKFLRGFTGRALASVKAGVGAGSRELSGAVAKAILGFVLSRPVRELAREVEPDRVEGAVAVGASIVADLDDDETFRARRRELVVQFVERNAKRPTREVLADYGIRVAPHVPSLAAATFPLVRGVLGLAPIRAWFTQLIERVEA